MGLMKRIEAVREQKAREANGTLQVQAYTGTGEKVTTSPWVTAAGEGARIGQPLNGRGLPVRIEH